MTTLQDVVRANPNWFTPENQRLFNDISYTVRYGEVSKKPYLVRDTYAWTDMFGQPKRLHYRLNPIGEDLSIGSLLDQEFRDMTAVEEFLAGN